MKIFNVQSFFGLTYIYILYVCYWVYMYMNEFKANFLLFVRMKMTSRGKNFLNSS